MAKVKEAAQYLLMLHLYVSNPILPRIGLPGLEVMYMAPSVYVMNAFMAAAQTPSFVTYPLCLNVSSLMFQICNLLPQRLNLRHQSICEGMKTNFCSL